MRLLDTTFLIDALKGDPGALKKAAELDEHIAVYTTEISVFEIVLGVYFKKKNTKEEILKFEKLISQLVVLPLQRDGAYKAGEIAGTLMREGKQIGETDCIIAGIALANDINTIITRNNKHFSRIKGLKVESY